LSRLAQGIDRLNLIGAWVAAAACAILATILIIEVLVTSSFAWSQPWAVEYTAYLTALTLFGGAGYALRNSSHIRVAVLPNYLPAPLARALDLACTLAALVVTVILSYGLIELAMRSHARNSRSYFVMQTPLAIPQALLAASIVLLALALLARALRILINEAPDVPDERSAGEGAAE
jgi:TRAP-type C4-dicarboxylate transport system permease small subunit